MDKNTGGGGWPRDEEIRDLKATGRFCRVCGEPQVASDGGPTCANGHGGADDVGAVGAGPIREAWKAKQEAFETKQKAAKDESVRDVSSKLRDELGADAKTFGFRSGQRRAGEKPLRQDLQDVVETIWVTDIREEWKRIRKSIAPLGLKRAERQFVEQRLDEARQNSYDAHRLYLTAKIEYERWESENEMIFGAMWGEAVRSLQADKESGSRSKQITDADVKAKCATLFPDEYKAQEMKRRAVKLTVDSLAQLAKDASEYCFDLQSRLGKRG